MATTSDTAEDGPWVGIEGGRSRKLHENRDCRTLKTPNSRPASTAEIERLEECQHCAGDIDYASGRGNRPGRSLENMSAEEFDEHLDGVGLR